jgi:hypothetical protein
LRPELSFLSKVVTRVLERFKKKPEANDPELEAAIRARLEQDMASVALRKAAEEEHWERIRERVETAG